MEKRGLSAELAKAEIRDAATVAFADEMRVGLIGQVRRRWVPKGFKLEQKVEYKYEWAYLNLAVNGITGKFMWDWTENMKGASIAPVVQQWHTEQGVKAVVWDGARGHRGPAYEDVPVARIQQPAYSPQVNPAERVFEYLRSQIEGIVYGSIDAKKQVVEAELENLAQHPERVKSIAGWPWIRQAFDSLTNASVVNH